MKLNIGCGKEYVKGWVNLDCSKEVKADVYQDIEYGLNFAEDSFDEIRAWRVLEHIVPNKWVFVLNEIHRVAKNGCKLDIIVPFDNIHGRCCVDHYRAFSWDTFWALEQNRKDDSPKIKLRLKRTSKPPARWLRILYYIIPSLYKGELHFTFEVIK